MLKRWIDLIFAGVAGALLGVVAQAADRADPVVEALSLARGGQFARSAELLEALAASSPQATYYAGWMRAQAGEWRVAADHWSEPALEGAWKTKSRTAAISLLEKTALEAYRAGKYSETLEASERALDFGDRPESWALTGLALLRLGRIEEARQALSAAAPRLSSGGALHQEVKKILDAMVSKDVTESVVSVGAGSNSNLFGDGASEEAVAAGFLDVDASLKRIWSRGYFAEIQGRWQEYLGMPDSRYFEVQGGLGIRYFGRGFGAEVEFGALYQGLGNDADSVSPQVRVSVERRMGARVLTLDYLLSRPLVALDALRFLNSDQHELTLELAPVAPDWRPSYRLLFRRESGADIEEGSLQLPLAHVAIGAGASIGGALAARTFLSCFGGVEHRIYDHKAFPGIEERLDWNYSVLASIRRSVGSGLVIFASGKAEINRSTLGSGDVDDRNSFGTVFAAGLEWRQ